MSGSATGTYLHRPKYLIKCEPVRKYDEWARSEKPELPVIYSCKLFFPCLSIICLFEPSFPFSLFAIETVVFLNPLHKYLGCKTNTKINKKISMVNKAIFPLGYFMEMFIFSQEPCILNYLMGIFKSLIFWLLTKSPHCSWRGRAAMTCSPNQGWRQLLESLDWRRPLQQERFLSLLRIDWSPAQVDTKILEDSIVYMECAVSVTAILAVFSSAPPVAQPELTCCDNPRIERDIPCLADWPFAASCAPPLSHLKGKGRSRGFPGAGGGWAPPGRCGHAGAPAALVGPCRP